MRQVGPSSTACLGVRAASIRVTRFCLSTRTLEGNRVILNEIKRVFFFKRRLRSSRVCNGGLQRRQTVLKGASLNRAQQNAREVPNSVGDP